MRAHRRAASAALLAAALAAPLAPPAHAAPERPRPHRVTAFVELVGVPAVDAATTARSDPREAARAARERTGNNADAVVDAVRSVDRGAARVGVTVNAVPGVVLTAEPAVLRWVAGMPQVRSVRQAVPKRVDNAGAVRLTGAADVWRAVGPSVPGHGVPGHGAGAVHGEGLRGEGLRIGVVDTGVDYTHADFGGAGGYDGVDRAGPWEPGAKVVGGYDFAGDDYDASDPEHGEPSPDPNPIDCQGHGTHVAGTAAGYGVGADGSTFTGAHSGLSDDDLAAMRIGPGTAPAAQVYALKVFGCSGSTNVVSQALDWALDPDGDGDPSDHLDVVNLSLGSDFGAVDDPDSAFVRKLVRHGVVVVASAGNAGDLYDSGGSPGSTPEAVTVANTRDASVLLDGVGLPGAAGGDGEDGGDEAGGSGTGGDGAADASGEEVLPGQYGREFAGYADLDVELPVAPVADAGNADGCAPIDQDLSGRLVWLEWDDSDSTRECGSAVRADHARDAGAAGAVLTSGRTAFGAGIAGNADIPMFQLTGPATERVRPLLADGSLRLRLAGALRDAAPTVVEELADTVTPSSARGSRAAGGAKPDLAAPGDTIVSALVGSGDEGVSKGGTSMAAPHVAGLAALVRQAHPDWTVEEVKAALVNTASAPVVSGDDRRTGLVEGTTRVGAGRVDARAAVRTGLLALVPGDPGSVGVSFGPVEAGGPVELTRSVELVNKTGDDLAAVAAYRPATEVPGAEVEVLPRTARVPAGGSARVSVRLRVDPAALRKVGDPTLEVEQRGHARQFLAEVSGRVVFRAGAHDAVLPVYAAPRPVSALSARAAAGGVELVGRGLDQGEGAEAYRSLVSAFELHGRSPELAPCGAELLTGCLAVGSARGGDLRYAGASAADGVVSFGVATWGTWTGLGAGGPTPVVGVDVDRDGAEDYRVQVARPVDGSGKVVADLWLARTTRVSDDEVVDERPVNGWHGEVDSAVMDTDVGALPVSLEALGIAPGGTGGDSAGGSPGDLAGDSAGDSLGAGLGGGPLRYRVRTRGWALPAGTEDGVVDRFDGWFDFDPAASRVALPVGSTARDGLLVPVRGAGEVLVLHHHNGGGSRAGVVVYSGE
ncbi:MULTISPECIES: S8 family serine peptidase [Actinosynnema]|uniref:S8 family peptidase n=1 Tax=Actinosynnema TaxID=40566 RepID=UPI002646647A|nr:S8 family serine peptidase [Actinosynnema pretiosum]MCP2096828.1 PA domain-containing protein [Actinosynnema pretiosum]